MQLLESWVSGFSLWGGGIRASGKQRLERFRILGSRFSGVMLIPSIHLSVCVYIYI